MASVLTKWLGSGRRSSRQVERRRSGVLAAAVDAVARREMPSFGVENLEARQMLALVHLGFDEADASGIVVDDMMSWGGYYVSDAGVSAWEVVQGQTGKAIQLNTPASDKDYVLFVDAGGVNQLSDLLGGNATVAFWIKTTATGGSNPYDSPNVLGIDHTSGGDDIFWGWINNQGRIGFNIGTAGGVQSTNAINDGRWHHVAMSRSIDGTRNDTTPAPTAGTIWLYVDGSLNGTTTLTDVSQKNLYPYNELGKLRKHDRPADAIYLSASLDELNFGSDVLSDRQIKLLFDPSGAAPAAASNVRIADGVKDLGSRGVRLTFTDNSANESGFRIERSADNGTTWTLVGTLGNSEGTGKSLTYLDRSVNPSTSYRYRVVAYGAWGDATAATMASAVATKADAPYTAGGGTGVLGTYFDEGGTPDSAGKVDLASGWKGKMIMRNDPMINFNWGSGSPDPRIGVDTFTARWEGKIIVPKSDYYVFTDLTDDGSFLYLKGVTIPGLTADANGWVKIIDDPTYHGMTLGTDDRTSQTLVPGGLWLEAGTYAFKMESYDNTSGSGAILMWSSMHIANEAIPMSQLLPPDAEAAAPAAPSTVSATANGSNLVTVTWPDVANERGYKVYRSRDDRSYDEVGMVAGTSYTDTTAFPNKTYYYKIKAFNLRGESAWVGPAQATTAAKNPERGLNLEYWNARGTSAADGIPSGAPTYTRVDNVDRTEGTNVGLINYPAVDGATNSAKLAIPGENDGLTFTIRWTGIFVPPTTGNYTFWTRTDDDVRFWLGGSRLIAQPNSGNFATGRGVPTAPGDSSGALALTAGVQYALRMDYTQGTGGGTAELRVQGPAGSPLATQQILPTQVSGTTLLYTLGNLPAMPTNVAAVPASGAVKLTWNDSSFVEDGFFIEQSSDGSTWQWVGTAGPVGLTSTSGSYIVTGLTPATNYQFRVRAYNAAGETDPTAPVLTTTKALSTTPVANWEFNENTGASSADAVAGGTAAALSSGATWSTRGHGNASVRVPQGVVTVADSPQLNPTTQITVAAWMYAYDWAGNRRILQKGDTDNQYRLLIEDATVGGVTEKYLRFHLANKPVVQVKLSSIANNTNVWHHVAGTYDGAKIRLYVDGVEVASTSAAGPLTATPNPLYIGSRNGSTASDRFNGKIDGVRIYDTAVSAAEIATLAGETAPAAPTDLAVNVPSGAAGLFRLDLSWKDNSVTNYPSFRILRSTTGVAGSFVDLGVAVDQTTFSDTTVIPRTKYYYQVVAVNRMGQASSAVAIASTMTPPDGSLSTNVAAVSGDTNLSTVGNLDWVHWGQGGASGFSSRAPQYTQAAGATYLIWEAEDAYQITDPNGDNQTWRVIDGNTTPTVTQGAANLPSSGAALLADVPQGTVAADGGYARYRIYVRPGTYYLYTRVRCLDPENDATGNNDSMLVPTALLAPNAPAPVFDTNNDVATGNRWTSGQVDYTWYTNTAKTYVVASEGWYDFWIGTRERYFILDRLALSTSNAAAGTLDTLANAPSNLTAGQISNFTVTAGAAPTATTTTSNTFTWSDGNAPVEQVTATNAAVSVAAGTTLRFTAPASPASRKLRVYVNIGASSSGQLKVNFSDASVADSVLTRNVAGPAVFELTFKAGMADQRLNLEWTTLTGTTSLVGAAWVEYEAPAAPSNLALVTGRNGINLSWNDASANETIFKIERSTDGVEFTEIGQASSNVKTFSDATAAVGTRYYYRVRAGNVIGNSAYSNVANLMVVTGQATGLSGVGRDGGVQLNWTSAGEGAVYAVKRNLLDVVRSDYLSPTPSLTVGPDEVLTTSLTTTSFFDATAVPGKEYYYSIALMSGSDMTFFGAPVLINAMAGTPYVRVNFSNATGAAYSGYVKDAGTVFAAQNGFTYGWAADNTAQARDRNDTSAPLPIDERYDSLNHLQLNSGDRIWEIEVPNGDYWVHVVGGDIGNVDCNIGYLFEKGTANQVATGLVPVRTVGSQAANDSSPLQWRFVEYYLKVRVTDGRLTVQTDTISPKPNPDVNTGHNGNNKITYIDINLIPANQPPVAPSALTATAVQGGIQLKWTDNSDDETGFKVERQQTDGSWQLVGTVSTNTTTYTDTSAALVPGTTYAYRVLATNLKGDSAAVNGASAVAPLRAPADLQGIGRDRGVKLTWTAPQGTPVTYNLLRAPFTLDASGNGVPGASTIIASGFNGTTYTDKDASLVVGQNYFYWIESAAGSETSGYGNPILTTAMEGAPFVRVNFTNEYSTSTGKGEDYAGYVKDVGSAYADRNNGLSYGWLELDTGGNLLPSDAMQADARDRDRTAAPAPIDERYDSFTHLQKRVANQTTWEIEVPNGVYYIHVVGGDPDNANSDIGYAFEPGTANEVLTGVKALQTRDEQPTAEINWRFAEFYVIVTVTDGKLTMTTDLKSPIPKDANGVEIVPADQSGYNNKLAYIDINKIGDVSGPWEITGSAVYVKRNGDNFERYDNATGTGTPVETKSVASVSEIKFTGTAGDDTVVFDLGAFDKPVSADGAAGTDTVQIVGSTVVTAANHEVLGSGNSLTLIAGAHQLGANVAGKVLTINAGATAVATADLSVAGLTLNGDDALDLKTFDVTVAGGDAATLAGYVKSGALFSTATTNITTLGVIPQDSAVLVKYTYYGDINGDGSVNLTDYFTIDSGYLNKRSGFANGDVNYDGEINLNDYFLIDSAYLNQKGTVLATPAAAQPKAVFSTAKIAKKVKKAKPAKKAKKA